VRRTSAIRNPNPNGFTLIEIVITIVIVGVLAGIASLIILQGIRSYSDEEARSNVHYQARFAMERMAREIRLIRSASLTDITSMTNINLRFTDVNGAATGFNWANPILNRWNGVGNDVLATGITAFNLNYFQQDGVTPAAAATLWFVEITMTSQQGSESLQMRTRVHPRNF
jgi:prepilin-type N-terminal cleavage/methylation domain-containing protein